MRLDLEISPAPVIRVDAFVRIVELITRKTLARLKIIHRAGYILYGEDQQEYADNGSQDFKEQKGGLPQQPHFIEIWG
jgi:hypothetical protein